MEVLDSLVQLLNREVSQKHLEVTETYACFKQIFGSLAVLDGLGINYEKIYTEYILVVQSVVLLAILGGDNSQSLSVRVAACSNDLLA